MGRTNFVEPIPEVPDRLLAPLPFCSVGARDRAENLELIFFWPLRWLHCCYSSKVNENLIADCPQRLWRRGGGGGKLSGGGVGHRQDPSVGRERVRPSVRPASLEGAHGNGMGCCRRQRGRTDTEETREGGSAARQAGGGNQQLPSQSLPLSLSLSLCLSLPSRFTTKTTL